MKFLSRLRPLSIFFALLLMFGTLTLSSYAEVLPVITPLDINGYGYYVFDGESTSDIISSGEAGVHYYEASSFPSGSVGYCIGLINFDEQIYLPSGSYTVIATLDIHFRSDTEMSSNNQAFIEEYLNTSTVFFTDSYGSTSLPSIVKSNGWRFSEQLDDNSPGQYFTLYRYHLYVSYVSSQSANIPVYLFGLSGGSISSQFDCDSFGMGIAGLGYYTTTSNGVTNDILEDINDNITGTGQDIINAIESAQSGVVSELQSTGAYILYSIDQNTGEITSAITGSADDIISEIQSTGAHLIYSLSQVTSSNQSIADSIENFREWLDEGYSGDIPQIDRGQYDTEMEYFNAVVGEMLEQYQQYSNQINHDSFRQDIENLGFAFLALGNVVDMIVGRVPYVGTLIYYSGILGFLTFFLGIAGGVVGAIVQNDRSNKAKAEREAEKKRVHRTSTVTTSKRTKLSDGSIRTESITERWND